MTTNGLFNRLQRVPRKIAGMAHERQLKHLRAEVAAEPLNSVVHEALAKELAKGGRHHAAHAVLRSAAFLSTDRAGGPPVTKFRAIPDDLRCMNHNQYFRFDTLSGKLRELAGSETISVLDVGGGDGELAQFLPEVSYFLAEPAVNGISGVNLPFGEETFDYVVSCHVLEHIPIDGRGAFLDSLMLCARRGVVLLNPFEDLRTSADERLQLFIDVMDAPWAHEHLECTLPKLETVYAYAEDRGFDITAEPNGFTPFAAAIEIANHFCALQGNQSDFRAINRYFNERLQGLLNVADCPNAMLVTLIKQRAEPISA